MCMHSSPSDITEKPVSKKKEQREAEIRDYLMTLVPSELPEEVDDWIEDVCLGNHHFIFYNKKERYALCTRCKKEIDKRFLQHHSASHNNYGRCPVCNHDIVYKCIGRFRAQRRSYYEMEPCMERADFSISVMQKVQTGILIRKFYMVRRVVKVEGKAKVELSYHEGLRIFNDAIVPRRYAKNWSSWNASEKTSLGGPEYEYRKNVAEIIAGSPFQYAKKGKDHYYYAAWIKPVEYLEKAKWDHLAGNILNHNTKYLKLDAASMDRFLHLPKLAIKFAQQNNFGVDELQALRILLKETGQLPKRAEHVITLSDKMYWFKKAKKIAPSITANDFVKFTEKSPTQRYDIDLWADYLSFCKDLGYDLKSAEVLYPKSIKEAHDREMVRVKVKANEVICAGLVNKFEQDKKLTRAISGMIIRPPKDLEELLFEGATLNHCVGTYADRIAKNETTILFIRKTDHPEDPFYTLEWRNNRVAQCRGYRNCTTTPEVEAFLKLWQAKLAGKKTSDKSTGKVAAAAV